MINNDNIRKSSVITVYEPGMFGSCAFRIPSLLTTVKGTLIAGIDVRYNDIQDNPNQIAIGLRRSTDRGDSWGDLQVPVRYPGEGLDGAASLDSALLEDRVTGTIWMIFSHTPGGVGLRSSRQGKGFDPHGFRLLYDAEGRECTLREGIVFDSEGKETHYAVAENGDVLSSGRYAGNIYLKEGVAPQSFLEARTSFLQAIKSDDDGLTWSSPIELNLDVKQPWMRFIGAGPGRGIQLQVGANQGRLLFPVYFSNASGILSCAVIYSDDHGKSWAMGRSPNDGRQWQGETVSAESLTAPEAQLTESQAVELDNGELLLYMRNHAGCGRTAVSSSQNGGETWGEVRFEDALPNPTCQATVIRYPDREHGRTLLLWANPAHVEHRRTGKLRLSEDGGKCWGYSRTVHPGEYGYSCLSELPDGEAALLYEADGGTIRFTTFTLAWVRQKK
ncbi:sialidase family protein [Paenibacillus oceani]|uniref:exo-alpha-sialidase n=1 Tax=Paenibacillus oceani TaxID=2772510 RepID=A0A927CEF9_9BACL|nr:sialidase family protein [Paenibacillus oceani]MBD2866085.1 exo-alpha-sialidase [Paenibacillus oceani]